VSGISLSGSRPAPTGGFERFAWVFMRVSGLVLVFLAMGHLAIMHLINSIDTIDYDFVVRRYATPLWRTYDALMLFLALLHGFNGLRVVLEDHLRGPARAWMQGVLVVFTAAFALLGCYAVFAFQPR
jgi:succinate dehydrogenase / fumarate reductase membrane anchor subunit